MKEIREKSSQKCMLRKREKSIPRESAFKTILFFIDFFKFDFLILNGKVYWCHVNCFPTGRPDFCTFLDNFHARMEILCSYVFQDNQKVFGMLIIYL